VNGVPLTDVLVPRDVPRASPLGHAIADAGGLWMPHRGAEADAVVAAVRERGIRALEVHGDLSFVRELPDLEFLTAMDPPDVAPIHDLHRLRLLGFSGTWTHRLDGTAWPRLEWFDAVETPRGGGGLETVYGCPQLRSLGVGRFPDPDLTGVHASGIEDLSVGQSRSLTSLAGIERWADTLVRLTVDASPNLTSLEGIESLRRLEVLELAGLRQIRSLDAVATLPSLRFLDVSDLKDVESLGPLAGHPTLEHVSFGRTADLDVGPMFEIPNLKLAWWDRRIKWNRDVSELPHLIDVPADDPRQAEWARCRA
jgi:hypothetical protein